MHHLSSHPPILSSLLTTHSTQQQRQQHSHSTMAPAKSPPVSPKHSSWLAGRRRNRPNRSSLVGTAGSIPRSTTMPTLHTPSFAGSSTGMSSGFMYPRSTAAAPTRRAGTPTSASPTPTAATEGRKKRTILSVLKSRERPASVHAPSPELEDISTISPIPPHTPAKAAALLGFEPPMKEENDKEGDQDHQVDGERATGVRPPLLRKSSFQWLGLYDSTTTTTDKQTKQTRFREEHMDETESPAATSNWRRKLNRKVPNKKAMELLDLKIDPGYSSDSDLLLFRRGSRPASTLKRETSVPASQCRSRKKAPKSLERMSPITEASLSEDVIVLQGDSDKPVLESISEDERPRDASGGDMFFSIEEREADIQADSDDYDGYTEPVPSALLHRKTTKLQKIERPETVHTKSPLQSLEHMLLGNQEKMTFVGSTTEQLGISHDELRQTLRAINAKSADLALASEAEQESRTHRLDSEIDDGVGNKIDFDYKPRIVTDVTIALQPITMINPRMIKIVDIRPPNKSQTTLKTDNGKAKVMQTHKDDGSLMPGSEKHNVSTLVGDSRERSTTRMGKEASLEKVKSWVDDQYNPLEQRPLPERVDPAVLEEQQQLPPAPPSKDGLDSYKIKVPRHICLNTGHVFNVYDLQSIPDDVSINTLGLRPYLLTQNRVKQHVDVPIYCEKCNFGCKEQLWVCDIPICHLSICRYCAHDMEEDMQKRAADSWNP
ncbi:hypothetical protein K504DRAFT_208972 [Pleomassaria siparia CBS 279.74]|uniref:Uncharacterized protein n=1 Tax=Pleomassaria siparia CBS 279.74 TaxID=1314801 RepID=A0A6G1KJ82_9PLEO|nr:hypothetical protein K504DRAFT_208972 [Pleomassaria siparia CBS 279.74]